MDTILVVAIALAASVIAVFLTYSILRWRLKRQFRNWQDEQLVLWQREKETAPENHQEAKTEEVTGVSDRQE